MLNQVILRLIEICKEKSIIKENVSLENKDDINDIINVLSEKTSISKSTLKSIFYKSSTFSIRNYLDRPHWRVLIKNHNSILVYINF